MAHNQDWREWLESLNASGAEYVVVGAIALALHGVVRYTGDIDVLVRATAENAARVLGAMRLFGFGTIPLSAADLSLPDRVVQLGIPPGRIGILTSIDGLSWDEVSADAVSGNYGAHRSVTSRSITSSRTSERQDVLRTWRMSTGWSPSCPLSRTRQVN